MNTALDPRFLRPSFRLLALATWLSACGGPAWLSSPAEQRHRPGSSDTGYEVLELGSLGGGDGYAFDVNDQGQVIGTSTTAAGDMHAFLWQDGGLTDLGTLGGTWSGANAINQRGQVVGHSANSAGERRTFLWSNGIMQDLGDAWVNPAPLLNSRGQVAWTVRLPDGTTRARLWTDGATQDLGALGDSGRSAAAALNDRGQVVGESNGLPFLWEDGTMRELPAFGSRGWASDINQRGQAVGAAYDRSCGEEPPCALHAVLWEGDQVIDLGRLPEDSHASGMWINDAGRVVVHSYPFSWYPQRAFLWNEGVITRLTTILQYYGVTAVNANGVIVAEQRPGNRYQRAVVWEGGVTTQLPLPEGADHTIPTALSDRGWVVGTASTPTVRHAVLWRKATTSAVAVNR